MKLSLCQRPPAIVPVLLIKGILGREEEKESLSQQGRGSQEPRPRWEGAHNVERRAGVTSPGVGVGVGDRVQVWQGLLSGPRMHSPRV